jgi:hypothetical protein
VIVGLNNASVAEAFLRTLLPFDCDQSRHADVPIAIAKTMRGTFDPHIATMLANEVFRWVIASFFTDSHFTGFPKIQAAIDLPSRSPASPYHGERKIP